MSTSIYGSVEVKLFDDGLDDWFSVIDSGPIVTGNYDFFGCLFGVRNPANFEPLFPERGLPENCSEEIIESYADGKYHKFATWCSYSELLDIDLSEKALAPDQRVLQDMDGVTVKAFAQNEEQRANAKIMLLTSFILLLGACASNDPRMTQGGVNEKTGVWENTVMSPYLELEKKYLEGKLIVRIVTTLGDERVTDGHYFTGNLTKDGKVRYKDGFTPEVTEVYFLNYSDSDIKVTPLTIEVFDSGTIKMKDNEIVVPAHNWKISSKHISATSVLINNRPVKFQFLLNGQEKEINGKVIRMSESAVKAKYSKN